VEVADHFDAEFDTVVIDPLWNSGMEKRRPKYDGEYVDSSARMKDGVAEVVRPGGRVIMFGYTANGVGEARGFRLEEVAVMHFTGNHHDALATVERWDRHGDE
jgi:hypothetical protein